MSKVNLLLALVLLLFPGSVSAASSAVIDVDVDRPGAAIPPVFAGLMTEEINHSYDGGLFAELIQNRTFQDPGERHEGDAALPAHWSLVQGTKPAKVTIDSSDPVTPALPRSLRVELAGERAGVANDGYWGIPIRPGTTYTASFYAKGGGDFAGPVTAALVTDDGARVAEADTAAVTSSWNKYTLTLTTRADAPTTAKAKFVLFATGTGSVSFSLVSLFPPTYGNVPNGLRPDLMQLMADMHPAFIRLPGGNYLEGDTFETRFDWKKMIGRPEDRPGHMGCWGYRSSDGFGLPQYLLWCRQLNAEPVLALFAGYTLKGAHVNAGSPEMQKFTDEALDEIEYVSGSADTEWGKKRAADGLKDPFPLHYVEIGNEDWFDKSGSYDGRFTQMFDAIRRKYPDLKIIATAPVKSRTPDLYDDHYYRSVAQMCDDSGHYDAGDKGPLRYAGGHFDGTHDRAAGPKVFVGEWATREGDPTPTLRAALADSVWLMGLERDSDLVQMECYAPLFANVNRNPKGWQWATDLIGYDALTAFGSPSYYAQAMFGQNRGDHVLPTNLTVSRDAAPATQPAPHGAVGVGTWHSNSDFKDIVVTGPDGKTLLENPTRDVDAWKFTGQKWRVQRGAVAPSAPDTETWAVFGDPSWTDYTIHLKARKTGGNEGFLILYRVRDDENFGWWNVGGWRNTKTQLEMHHDGEHTQIGRPANFRVETGRWYDLRVEVKNHHIRCFADGKLISEADERPAEPRNTFFASATYASGPGDVIVKVVNLAPEPVSATLNLRGVKEVKPTGKAIVLTGSPKDVNTVEQPKKVAPAEEQLTGAAPRFQRTFPPNSLTLIRVGASPAAK